MEVWYIWRGRDWILTCYLGEFHGSECEIGEHRVLWNVVKTSYRYIEVKVATDLFWSEAEMYYFIYNFIATVINHRGVCFVLVNGEPRGIVCWSECLPLFECSWICIFWNKEVLHTEITVSIRTTSESYRCVSIRTTSESYRCVSCLVAISRFFLKANLADCLHNL